jgi:hypothetical protein
MAIESFQGGKGLLQFLEGNRPSVLRWEKMGEIPSVLRADFISGGYVVGASGRGFVGVKKLRLHFCTLAPGFVPGKRIVRAANARRQNTGPHCGSAPLSCSGALGLLQINRTHAFCFAANFDVFPELIRQAGGFRDAIKDQFWGGGVGGDELDVFESHNPEKKRLPGLEIPNAVQFEGFAGFVENAAGDQKSFAGEFVDAAMHLEITPNGPRNRDDQQTKREGPEVFPLGRGTGPKRSFRHGFFLINGLRPRQKRKSRGCGK